MTEPKKRGPGRPRKNLETRLVAIRAPVKPVDVAQTIESAIAMVKLANAQPHTPTPVILLECLRARLKQLSNRLPKQVEASLNNIEAALAHYGE